MKKLSLCLIGLSLLLPLLAQQGTVTMTFADCFTTYGEFSKKVYFPFTYEGVTYTEAFSGQQTLENRNFRGCDSIVNVKLTALSCPVGAINEKALFSISEDAQGNKTYAFFSKSNLQYKVENHIFRFADEQYDFDEREPSVTQGSREKWSDLFAYGTSGGGDSRGKINLPEGGAYADDYPTWNISGTNYDWGVYNDIQVGDDVAEKETWRTMTIAEINYLISHHNAGYVVLKNIDGYHRYGLIMLPDEWQWPLGVTAFTLATNKQWTKDWNFVVPAIDLETWKKLETNGAVFFPCHKGLSSESIAYSGGTLYLSGSFYGSDAQNHYADGFAFGNYNGGYTLTTALHSHDDIKTHRKFFVRLISEKNNK